MSKPSYREWSGPSPCVDKLWRLDVPAGVGPVQHRVLPDGCMDLVVRLHRAASGRLEYDELLIAGPSTTADLVVVRPGDVFLGVRYRTGWGGRCLGIDPQAVAGQVTRASAVSHRYIGLESEVAAGIAADGLGEAFRSLLRDTVQDVAAAGRAQVAVERIQASRGRVDLRRLAVALSISPRTLRREVASEAGLPPKVLARVFRFRYALTCASPSLAVVAAAAGYADQAHMTREFTALAGLSPARWMAETFKTQAGEDPIMPAA